MYSLRRCHHRRTTIVDDARGVGENLNETMTGCRDCDDRGLIVRGTHLLHVGPADDAAVTARRLQVRAVHALRGRRDASMLGRVREGTAARRAAAGSIQPSRLSDGRSWLSLTPLRVLQAQLNDPIVLAFARMPAPSVPATNQPEVPRQARDVPARDAHPSVHTVPRSVCPYVCVPCALLGGTSATQCLKRPPYISPQARWTALADEAGLPPNVHLLTLMRADERVQTGGALILRLAHMFQVRACVCACVDVEGGEEFYERIGQ